MAPRRKHKAHWHAQSPASPLPLAASATAAAAYAGGVAAAALDCATLFGCSATLFGCSAALFGCTATLFGCTATLFGGTLLPAFGRATHACWVAEKHVPTTFSLAILHTNWQIYCIHALSSITLGARHVCDQMLCRPYAELTHQPLALFPCPHPLTSSVGLAP